MLQKIIVWTLVVVATFVAGHVSGRMLQHARTGYHYRVRNEKDIPFQSRSLSVRYVTESVGLPFLDPGTTILALDDITIYKARRCFQEGFPVATDVSVNGDEIPGMMESIVTGCTLSQFLTLPQTGHPQLPMVPTMCPVSAQIRNYTRTGQQRARRVNR